MYDYSLVTGNDSGDLSAFFAALGSLLIVVLLITVALLVFMIITEWKFFKKAGKNGWECLIPFYNIWVLVEIAGLNWWWFLITISSTIASFIFGSNNGLTTIFYLATIFGGFVCNYNIAKKLHKDTGFAVLLTIFPIVMYPIVAFSKNYQFDHNVPISKNGIFGN